MRFSFKALAAAMALAMGASSANAEIYTMYTGPGENLPNTGSSLGLTINIANLISVPILPSALNGVVVVDMNLDASNSGTLYVQSATLALDFVSVSQSGNLLGLFPYSIDLALQNVGVSLTAGPIAVTNGAFAVTNLTVGSLGITSGSLDYDIVITSFGVDEQGSLNFADDPVDVAFDGLPDGLSIPGTADDDAGGTDNGDLSPHNVASLAGLTGISVIDQDGSEVTLNFNGIQITSVLDLGGTELPISITLSGGIAVGVPEVGSMTMVACAMTGLGGLAVVRRRRNG